MEQFKIDNYNKLTQMPFPDVTEIDEEKRTNLKQGIISRLALGAKPVDSLTLLTTIQTLAKTLDVNALESKFSLKQVLEKEGVQTEKIYINWDGFDEIDEMSLVDLDRCFSDIWYSAADDIEIFDDSLTWILSVRHWGGVAFLRFPALI